jgi:prepilin-type N-terminal cleavage/methylation domain-containing protein
VIDLLKYIKNRKAFTIVELIIAVSLLGLVLTMGYMLFSTMSNNFDRGTDQSYIQQNIRFVDEYFKNSIRNIGDFHIGTTQPADLGYSLFVEDEIAKADATEITDSVLDDVMLTVDFSGEFVAFEYTITGSDGDRTYELDNRIVLNNLPTDMISPDDMIEGAYSGEETSLQASKLFYDYDPVYKMIRVLKASPSIVTTGHTYTTDAPLLMHLVVSNDSFLTGITKLDITLDGDISSLSITDMGKQNDKVVLLQLTGSTPGATAVGEGTIMVADTALVG